MAKNGYTGHRLCPDLHAKETCFRGTRLQDGEAVDQFHFHVPSYRLTQDDCLESIRAIVATLEGWPAEFIVYSLMNNRGKKPEVYPGHRIVADYPEPGVQRFTASSTNSWAWFDKVISPDKFRTEA